MRAYKLFTYLFVLLSTRILFVQAADESSSAAPPTSLSIQTVTTDLAVETSVSSVCGYESSVGTLNGHVYAYRYVIEAENYQSFLVTYRQYTITWFFTFAEDIDATSFSAYYSGIHLDDLSGVVNIEKGQLMLTYTATFPYLTLWLSVTNYCIFEYVSWAWTLSDEEILNFYSGDLGSGIVNILDQLACGVVTLADCPIYSTSMDYNCVDLATVQTCNSEYNLDDEFSYAEFDLLSSAADSESSSASADSSSDRESSSVEDSAAASSFDDGVYTTTYTD
ncbi:uncharacterized protein CYBJADRAFT_179371, partial [Cyberlindnera jadinii NRRL Y-1542]